MADAYTSVISTEEAIAAATRETVIQLRGVTTTRARLLKFWISLDGVVVTDAPAVVVFERQSSDGTATGLTESPMDTAAPAAQVTAFGTFTSTMPTSSAILDVMEVHPQGGLWVVEWSLMDPAAPILAASTSDRLALTITSPTAVNCTAGFRWFE